MAKVLITGINGFLGKILAKNLAVEDIAGLDFSDADYICDITKSIPEINGEYDVVIHCAGKAHVIPKSDKESEAFFKVNHEGTVNVCKAVSGVLKKSGCFVLISSVSVYGREAGSNINEYHSLNGSTPYAMSKIMAEKYVTSWAIENQFNYLIFRLPLIVGDRPPGNLGKMVAAIKAGRFFRINHGAARKSMIVGSDLPRLIMNNRDKSGVYNLTDGRHPSFLELEKLIVQKLGVKLSRNLPLPLAKLLATIGTVLPFFPFNKKTLEKMVKDLTFDDSLAQKNLNWRPTPVEAILNELDL